MDLRKVLLVILAAIVWAGFHWVDGPPASAQPGDVTKRGPAVDRLAEDRLAEPVPVEANGQPVVRQGKGYALEYPFVGDIDGDGRADFLLGQRHKGRLRVFRNVGTPTAPRLTGATWFDEMVPSGTIPYG